MKGRLFVFLVCLVSVFAAPRIAKADTWEEGVMTLEITTVAHGGTPGTYQHANLNMYSQPGDKAELSINTAGEATNDIEFAYAYVEGWMDREYTWNVTDTSYPTWGFTIREVRNWHLSGDPVVGPYGGDVLCSSHLETGISNLSEEGVYNVNNSHTDDFYYSPNVSPVTLSGHIVASTRIDILTVGSASSSVTFDRQFWMVSQDW